MTEGGRAHYPIQSTQQATQAFSENRRLRPPALWNILFACSFAHLVMAGNETLEKKLSTIGSYGRQ